MGIFLQLCLISIGIKSVVLQTDIRLDKLVHSAVLDTDEKFHIFWNFNYDTITFEVQVQTLGYFGLGFSPNGGMAGSDVVVGGVLDGQVYLQDRHAEGMFEPSLDDEQNWTVVSGRENDTHTTVRFWRKLDTCDKKNDMPLTASTIRVIWAYHDEDWEVSKLRYHSSNRGTKSIFLLNPQRSLPVLPADSFHVDFIHNNVSVPNDDTTYWCESFSMPVLTNKSHVIKFEPIIQPGNEGLVHHIVLFICSEGTPRNSVGIQGSCFDGAMPEVWRGCSVTIFAWAVGGGPFYLPDHVGYPFGLDDDPAVILLQTHYDNPTRRSDFRDSSGIRLTLTTTLRQHDAGTLSTGLVVGWTHIIPPYQDVFQSDGHCVPECLTQGLGNKTSINVFATFLHAHLLSTGIKLRHVRDGIEQRAISVDDNYDFNLQETRVVEPEVQIKKGDHLITECLYKSTHKTNVTYGGESTYEEMCVSFIMFYPRVPLANCYSMVQPSKLAEVANVEISNQYNWTIVEPETYRGRSLYDIISNEVDWKDKEMSKKAQSLATSYENPVVAFCYKTAEETFPVNGDLVQLPMIRKAWQEKGTCLSGAIPVWGLYNITFLLSLISCTIFP